MIEVTTSIPHAAEGAPTDSGLGNGTQENDGLEKNLKELKDQAATNQKEITQLTKDTASIQQAISLLESGLAEIDQTCKAYEQGLKAIGAVDSLQTFADQKRKMATAAAGPDGVKTLDGFITTYDEAIRDQETKVKTCRVQSDKAVADRDEAFKSSNEAQQKYNDLKATLATVQARMVEIKNLKSQIDSAEGSGSVGSMYLLSREMQTALNALQIPSSEDLRTYLKKALSSLKGATKTHRERKELADQALGDLATAQKKLDGLWAGRRAALLEQAKNWKPPQPQDEGNAKG